MSFKMCHSPQFCHFGQYVTFHVTLDIVSKDNFSIGRDSVRRFSLHGRPSGGGN